jgi:hypothetical protein
MENVDKKKKTSYCTFFFFSNGNHKKKNYIERRKSFAALFTRSMESKRLDDLISS